MAQVATQGEHRQSGILDLALGHPSEELLPLDLLRDAAARRLGTSDASILQYGVEQGDPGFRRSLANLFAAEGKAADDLFVTSGASQALDLICTLFCRPGDLVLTSDPTYHLALRTFADHGLRVAGLASDDEGPLPDAVAAAARERPALLYLVTPFANPSGATSGPDRAERLLELAQSYDFWLVADEVYRSLSFRGSAPPSLAGSKAITLNSFSKILAPGLRLGWLAGPPTVLRKIEDSGLLRSGGGLNPLVAAVVGELIEEERFGWHLERLRATLTQRAEALTEALTANLPQARFAVPSGGYFIWLQLPGVDTAGLLPAANRNGVNYLPGSRFSTQGGLADYCRLSFAHYPPNLLHTAVERLARAVQSEAHDAAIVSDTFRQES